MSTDPAGMKPTVTAMERARLAIMLWRQEYDGGTVVGLGFLEDKLAAAIDKAVGEERERTRVESLEMRIAMMGACATLDDAASMGAPNAAQMRDLFRAILSQPTEPRGDHG